MPPSSYSGSNIIAIFAGFLGIARTNVNAAANSLSVTKEEAEKIAFPNDGKPPAEVTAFIEKTGDYMTKLNNEKKDKIVLEKI